MHNHACEKDRVEPREWRVQASNGAPGYGKEEIARVMDLASFAICGVLWVLNSLAKCGHTRRWKRRGYCGKIQLTPSIAQD
jgi:hypothetical protein